MKKFLIILSIMTCSCQQGKEAEIKKLKEEVMDVHDEVMPKMSELSYTRKTLLAQADTLMEANPERAAMYTSIADDISDANEAMMNWMRNYNPEYSGTDDEVLQYLKDQKQSIASVKEQMQGALAKGKEVLGE